MRSYKEHTRRRRLMEKAKSNIDHARLDPCLVPFAECWPDGGGPSAGAKCDHKEPNGGRWVVQLPDGWFLIEPMTNLQKDFWLCGADRFGEDAKEERIRMLRWWCFSCNTVQAP